MNPAQSDNYRELAHALTVCETALREIQQYATAEAGSGDPLAWIARRSKTALFKARSYVNDAERQRGQFLGQAHAPKREGKPLAPRFSPSERPAPENDR